MANSLDSIGSGLGRLEIAAPVTVGTTVTEKVVVTVSTMADMDGPMTVSTTTTASPTVQIKDVVETETVWMNNGRRGMPLETNWKAASSSGFVTAYG